MKTKSDPNEPINPPGDRVLRIITVITFLPGLALLIPHGVESHRVLPALGLVPLFLSSLFGLIHAFKTVRSRSMDEKIDAFLATFLFSLLVPGIISIPHSWYGTRLIGAYGTTTMIINLCIHVYFAARRPVSELFDKVFKNMFEPPLCPHCNGKQVRNWRKAARDGSVHSCEDEERYRDDPEADTPDEDQSVVSAASTAKQKQKQKAAPLFKTPPNDDDEDPVVLV